MPVEVSVLILTALLEALREELKWYATVGGVYNNA